jgi:hypothetical protein
VEVVAPREHVVLRSRFVTRRHPAPPGASADIVVRLAEQVLHDSARFDLVVFCDEPVLLSLQTPELDLPCCRARIPVPGMDTLACLTSKLRFQEATRGAGLPVPASAPIRDRNTVAEQARAQGYPLVVKQDTGNAGFDVRIVRSPEDLETAVRDLDGEGGLMLQAFIEGRLGTTDVLFDHGRPACWVSSFCLACLRDGTGPATVRELTDAARVEPLLNGLGVLTGFHGLAGIDWILPAGTDAPVLIEMNPRPTPGYHLGPRCGVDFTTALGAVLAGETVTAPPEPPRPGLETAYIFPTDLATQIYRRSLGGMLSWLPFMPRARDLPWHDPLLCLAALRKYLRNPLLHVCRETFGARRKRCRAPDCRP